MKKDVRVSRDSWRRACALTWDDASPATGTQRRTAARVGSGSVGDLEVFTLYGESSGVLCLAFSRDGRRLASGGYDWTAQIWDATALKSETPPSGAPAAPREKP